MENTVIEMQPKKVPRKPPSKAPPPPPPPPTPKAAPRPSPPKSQPFEKKAPTVVEVDDEGHDVFPPRFTVVDDLPATAPGYTPAFFEFKEAYKNVPEYTKEGRKRTVDEIFSEADDIYTEQSQPPPKKQKTESSSERIRKMLVEESGPVGIGWVPVTNEEKVRAIMSLEALDDLTPHEKEVFAHRIVDGVAERTLPTSQELYLEAYNMGIPVAWMHPHGRVYVKFEEKIKKIQTYMYDRSVAKAILTGLDEWGYPADPAILKEAYRRGIRNIHVENAVNPPKSWGTHLVEFLSGVYSRVPTKEELKGKIENAREKAAKGVDLLKKSATVVASVTGKLATTTAEAFQEVSDDMRREAEQAAKPPPTDDDEITED